MLQVYVGVQQDINAKRYADLEAQQQAQLAAVQTNIEPAVPEVPAIEPTLVTDSIPAVESVPVPESKEVNVQS